MGQISSRTLMAGALLLGLIGIGQPTRAQDEADPEEEQPVQQAQARGVHDRRGLRSMGFRSVRGAERAARQFESQLFEKIRELDRMYGLTPEQKKKLEVAGKSRYPAILQLRSREERLARSCGAEQSQVS